MKNAYKIAGILSIATILAVTLGIGIVAAAPSGGAPTPTVQEINATAYTVSVHFVGVAGKTVWFYATTGSTQETFKVVGNSANTASFVLTGTANGGTTSIRDAVPGTPWGGTSASVSISNFSV